MNDLWFSKPFARSHPVDVELIYDTGLRVYRNAPDQVHIQIRTRSGKQGRLTGLNLDRDEARRLGERLAQFAETGE